MREGAGKEYEQRGGAEGEAGSLLSRAPFQDSRIMTWAKGRHSTDWATQAPHKEIKKDNRDSLHELFIDWKHKEVSIKPRYAYEKAGHTKEWEIQAKEQGQLMQMP